MNEEPEPEPEPDDCDHESVFVGMADDGTCFYRCRKCKKEIEE